MQGKQLDSSMRECYIPSFEISIDGAGVEGFRRLLQEQLIDVSGVLLFRFWVEECADYIAALNNRLLEL